MAEKSMHFYRYLYTHTLHDTHLHPIMKSDSVKCRIWSITTTLTVSVTINIVRQGLGLNEGVGA